MDHPVKIRLEQAVLHDAILFELALGVRLSDLCGDSPGVRQDFAIGRSDEAIQAVR